MPFRVVSRVSRGMGVLVGGGDQTGRVSFGDKCGASHCNQWDSLHEGSDVAVPKLLWDFLL